MEVIQNHIKEAQLEYIPQIRKGTTEARWRTVFLRVEEVIGGKKT